MTDSLRTICYSEPTRGLPIQRTAASRLPFEATIACLKEAIQAEDLWLIHEIDPQMLMKRGGYEILATRQLLFFHPRYLARLLECDPSALVEAPLRLIIMEMPDGAVLLRHPEMALAFSRYSGLAELGVELSAVLKRILASVSN